MGLVDLRGHIDAATIGRSYFNSGLSLFFFPVEVAGTQFFVAVTVCGTLVPLVRNMHCAEEVVVHIQAALVPLYCPSLT